MATKHITGINTEKVEVNNGGNTWILDKNAQITSVDYGIFVASAANNTTVNVEGSINSAIAVYSEADKFKLNVGDHAKVVTQTGLLMVGTKEFDARIDGDVFGLQYGILSAAKNTDIDIGKGGLLESGVIGINAVGTGRFTAKIDGEIDAGQIGVLTAAQNAKVTVGKTGSVDSGVYGIYQVGTNSFNAKIDGDVYGGQYGMLATSEKTVITLGKGGSIEGGTYGIMSGGAGRLTAKINDDVNGGQYGFMTGAEKGKVEIGKGAEVEGGAYGFYMPASVDVTLVNRGTASGAGGYGIGLGSGADVKNFGDVYGVVGISATGEDLKIVNDGSINAMAYGIVAASTMGHGAKVTNHDLIVTSDVTGVGIVSGAGNDKIVNDGRIYGMIVSAEGDDKIDLRGGMVKGEIQGGNGDDTLITDKASHKLVEMAGQGDDTVQSSVTYKLSEEVERLTLTGDKNIDGTGTDTDNILRGNKGDNVLKGMAGMDELYGGKGDDKLSGGDDADVFHFSKGDGHDTIADLVTTVDEVDLSGWNAIQSFGQLKNHAQNDGNGNVVITAGNDSLTIIGMEKGDLDSGDFSF